LVTGRTWKGTAFGGWKSREDVPKLVSKVILGELDLDCYISNIHKGIEHINEAITNLHEGKILRDVI
jgi:S-(hydroxymethyl)glutathione dehydrogenase/alcohol dehydrogenase